jgi:hypothetical protein
MIEATDLKLFIKFLAILVSSVLVFSYIAQQWAVGSPSIE